MAYKDVILEKEGNIARVIMNKPDKMNTYSFFGGKDADAMEIWNAFDEAAEDDDVKVIIFKGAGRCFTVGHDLSKVGKVYGMGTGQAGERRPSQRIRLKLDRNGYEVPMRSIFLNPKITIAQVHGHCIGGAIFFAIWCDLVVAAEDSQFGFSEQRLGFAGSGVTMSHLVMTIGLKRTLDLLLTGRTFTGKEAAEMGLITKAVPPDKLEDEVEKLAKAMTLLPRDGIAIGKATRHLIYDRLGLTGDFTPAYISHTLFTNLRWEPDEYNFFKERRDKGTKTGFKVRDERYKGLT